MRKAGLEYLTLTGHNEDKINRGNNEKTDLYRQTVMLNIQSVFKATRHWKSRRTMNTNVLKRLARQKN